MRLLEKLRALSDDLRDKENAKIECGREHFKALGAEVGFTVAKDFNTFVEQAIG